MGKTPVKNKISRISALHYLKLAFRSLLFIIALFAYIFRWSNHGGKLFTHVRGMPVLAGFICAVYVVEMVFRFFPSSMESMGCQKQFKRNYLPRTEVVGRVNLGSAKTTFLVAVVWLAFNGVVGALYFAGIVDEGILLLISLFYGVCDMICILFFCPFQTWIMKNKCCGTCRIYNWDYAMMFTPLAFIPSLYSTGILAVAVALLVSWEVAVWRHPERFDERINQSLSCANCKEKLCGHKKQLRNFWKKSGCRFQLAGNQLINTAEEMKNEVKNKLQIGK